MTIRTKAGADTVLNFKKGGGQIKLTFTCGSPWTGWNQTIRSVRLKMEYIDSSGNSTVLLDQASSNKYVGQTINSANPPYAGGVFNL